LMARDGSAASAVLISAGGGESAVMEVVGPQSGHRSVAAD
jgi:hypothetical protein